MIFFNKLRTETVEVPDELKQIIKEYMGDDSASISYSLSEDTSNNNDDEVNEIVQEIDTKPQEPSFNTSLFSIIDQKNLKDSFVYKKAFVDRRVFSKIRSSQDYCPSKGTIIKLSLALELSLEETEGLLATAGYSLPKNSKENLVIIYLIEHKIFDVQKANNIFYTICRISLNQLY